MPDVVVVGGGHNGLVCAAYLARAGLSVTVVERRHVLGGAAVTEEVFPGFKYSVCSYAVSLLRPEIIRELGLARHGLTLLPLDGTFTPLHDGYLWRPEDPRAKHAEIARHSRRDADAYEDFTATMRDMAAFAKPLLGMIPPDPNAHRPARPARRRRSRPGVPAARRAAAAPADPAALVERPRFRRALVRERAPEGDARGVGDHRHLPRHPLAGHRLRAAAPLHGRDRRRLQVVGAAARRHRRGVDGDRRRRDRGRRRAADVLARGADPGRGRDGRRRGARIGRGDPGQGGRLERRPAGHVRAPGRPRAAPGRIRRHRARLPLPRRDRQGQPRARRLSRSSPAGRVRGRTSPAPSRSRRARRISSGPTTRRSTARRRRVHTWTS